MIPERFKNAKYEDVPSQIRKLYERMPETRRGLYIHGAVGTGKTHFCYGIKQNYDQPHHNTPDGYHPGRSSIMWNMTELLRDMRQDFDRSAYDKTQVEEQIMEFQGLVILDDVGSEKITDWVAETFYLIVNKRYNEMRPTIFTSNLNLQDLSERIGDRTVSRIVEMCDTVELIGADRRLKNANAKTQIKV